MGEGAKPTRWVVQAPCSLGAILERMGQSRSAAQDGRVFVDRTRCASLDTPLHVGSGGGCVSATRR